MALFPHTDSARVSLSEFSNEINFYNFGFFHYQNKQSAINQKIQQNILNFVDTFVL